MGWGEHFWLARLGAGIGHAVSLPALAAVGLFVGYVAGMFGVGGGFLLTPILIYVFGVPPPVAVGSALCQKCGTSTSSFLKYRRLGRGEPRIDLVMLGGSLIGVDAGTRLLSYLTGLGRWHVGHGQGVPAVQVVLDALFIALLSFTAFYTFRDAWQARLRVVPRGDKTIPGPLGCARTLPTSGKLLRGARIIWTLILSSRKSGRRPVPMKTFSHLVEHSPDAVLIKTPTQIVYANRAALTLFGAPTPAALLGKAPLDLVAPEDHAEVLGHLLPLFQGQQAAVRLEKPMLRLDGSRLDVEIAAAPIMFQEEQAVQVAIRDITERKRAVLAQSRLAAIVEAVQDAILSVAPDGTLVGWNPGAERLYGYGEAEIVGHPLTRLLALDEVNAAYQRLGRVLTRTVPEHLETVHVRKDGSLADVSVTVSAILGAGGEAVGAAVIARDITDRRRDERRIAAQFDQLQEYARRLEAQQRELEETNARLEALATTDGLTQLLNHRVFEQRLSEEFLRARRYGEPLSVILLDVDHFKAYNDLFGHLAGNEVLRKLSKVLQEHARETDQVARFGGEEFALILPHTGVEEAAALAERLRSALEETVWSAQHPITASFGVCVLTPEMDGPDVLVACADAAMYRAKAGGRNRVAGGTTAVEG
jgi:diguanylate cyclase (GGDEF)-like protein/PAS domain S-box-containing protein